MLLLRKELLLEIQTVNLEIYKSQKYNHNANTCIVGREGSASFDSGYGVIFGFTVHLPQ